jgi:hypothetical protein
MVTPELLDLPATWIPDGKATGVSSITLQLRGSISDTWKQTAIKIPGSLDIILRRSGEDDMKVYA